MHRLEVGELRIVASLNQRLPRTLYELRRTAAEHRLFTEEVALCFVLEGGLHDSCARAAKTVGVRHDACARSAACILMHRKKCRDAAAGNVDGADQVAWTLRCNHPNVNAGRWRDAVEVNVKSVREEEECTWLDVRRNLRFVHLLLRRVWDGDHDHIGALRRLSGGHHLKAVGGCNRTTL